MMLALTLAVGLLAAPEPQPEPQKGWVVEVRGFTYHRQAKPQPGPVEVQVIEAIYVDDLRAFFEQLKKR